MTEQGKEKFQQIFQHLIAEIEKDTEFELDMDSFSIKAVYKVKKKPLPGAEKENVHFALPVVEDRCHRCDKNGCHKCS